MSQTQETIERLSQENTRLSREVGGLRDSNSRLTRQLALMTSRVLEAESALDDARNVGDASVSAQAEASGHA